jgi:hypothetical protein
MSLLPGAGLCLLPVCAQRRTPSPSLPFCSAVRPSSILQDPFRSSRQAPLRAIPLQATMPGAPSPTPRSRPSRSTSRLCLCLCSVSSEATPSSSQYKLWLPILYVSNHQLNWSVPCPSASDRS